MKNRFHMIFTLIVLVCLTASSSSVFALSSNETPMPYDPIHMTIDERFAWVVENLEPVYIGYASHEDRSETLYTPLKTSYAGSSMVNYGKLETRVWFTCNDALTNVTDWGTSVFRATPYLGAAVDTDSSSARLSNDNVRIVYEAWFAHYEGAFFVEHWYNVYGDGRYAIYVNSGSY